LLIYSLLSDLADYPAACVFRVNSETFVLSHFHHIVCYLQLYLPAANFSVQSL